MLEAISTLKNKLIDAKEFRDEADDYFSHKLADIYLAYFVYVLSVGVLIRDDLCDCLQVFFEIAGSHVKF